MAEPRMSAVIVGCGAAGSAVARHMQACGIRIPAVCDTGTARAGSLARQLRSARTVRSVKELRQPADIYVLAVPDDAIGAVAGEMRRNPAVPETALVVHLAGAVGVDALDGLRCNVLVMHPVYSFAAQKKEKRLPDGLVWELTGLPTAVKKGRALVRRMRGKALVLSSEQKVLSHVAGVISCNYLSVLAGQAMELAGKTGAQAQLRLMEQTLKNIMAIGPEVSLTGPVARGDAETVARHLSVLKKHKKALVPLYCVLGQEAVALAQAGGKISRYKAGVLRKILKEGLHG